MTRNVRKSKLGSLPSDQRELLIRWLCLEQVTYEEAINRVAEQFQVRSSNGAMCAFWKRFCEPRIIAEQKLKNAFLDIVVRVRQGEAIIGETSFSVSLQTSKILDQRTTSPAGVGFELGVGSSESPTSHHNA